MLNHGNLKKKSQILYTYIYDDVPSNSLKEIYKQYLDSIKSIPGISAYNSISHLLHDSVFVDIQIGGNIVFTLELWDDNSAATLRKKLIFKNAKLISYNKVLKSGKIARQNKQVMPNEYLYDELYSTNKANYITIIFTATDRRIHTGYYFPMMTIQFETIDVTD